MTTNFDPSIFDDPDLLLGSQMLDYYRKEEWIELPFAIEVYKEYYYYANPDEDLDWETYLILLAFAPVIVTRLIVRYSPHTFDEKKVLTAFCQKYDAIAKWIDCLIVKIDEDKQNLLRNNNYYRSFEIIAEESIAFFHLSEKLFEKKQVDRDVPPVELCWNRELQNCYLSLDRAGLIGVASKDRLTKDEYYKGQKNLARLLQEAQAGSVKKFSLDVESYVISTAHEYAQLNSEFRWSQVYTNYVAVRKRLGRNFRIDRNLQELRLHDGKLQPNSRKGQRRPQIIHPEC